MDTVQVRARDYGWLLLFATVLGFVFAEGSDVFMLSANALGRGIAYCIVPAAFLRTRGLKVAILGTVGIFALVVLGEFSNQANP